MFEQITSDEAAELAKVYFNSAKSASNPVDAQGFLELCGQMRLVAHRGEHYSVRIAHHGENKISLIKIIRGLIPGTELVDAKEMAESKRLVATNVTLKKAGEIAGELRKQGATMVVEEVKA